MTHKLILTSLFCGFLFSSIGQKPSDYTYLQSKYKENDVVFLNESLELTINVVNDEIQILDKKTEEIYYNTSKAALYSKESVSSSFFHELLSVNAHVLTPVDDKYSKIKVKNFNSNQQISQKYFVDDIVTTNFDLPSLKQGAISFIQTEHNVKAPQFSIPVFWTSYSPIVSKILTITTDANVELEFTFFNMSESELEYIKTTKGKKIIHQWIKKDIEANKSEAGGPNPRYYFSHFVIRVKSFTKKSGERIPILTNVSDLHNWYLSMLNQVKLEKPEIIKKILAEIIQDEMDEEQKVKTVFNWVQNNIKYIAIEDGLGGLIPRDADLVMERRYGDCKDMSNLIVEMLRAIDIEGHHTWIGTRDIPYSYTELPSPIIDNHMIAAYRSNKTNKFVYLDATDSYIRYGLPTEFIQGKEALINLKDGFLIDTVPVLNSDFNKLWDSVTLNIQDEKLIGEGKIVISGYFDTQVRHRLNSISDAQEKQRYIKSYTLKGTNKYQLKDFDIQKSDTNISFNYSFDIDNYVIRHDDKIYVNMNIEKLYDTFKEFEKDRIIAWEDDFMRSFKMNFRLKIPEGYKLDYLPENSSINHDFFDYDISYQTSGEYINYEMSIHNKFLILEPENFDQYNKAIKQLKSVYKESVVLQKKP